jgi:DNA (cytosine-5)-methyltransferase 1
LRGYLETGNKKRKSPTADAGTSVEASGLIGGIDYEHNAHGPNDVTGPLLKGSPTGGGHPLPAIPYRKSKRACSTTDNETWVPADASNTLNNFDLGDTRTTHAVVQPVAWTQNQREEVRLLGDKVGAIALPGTHQTNYIAEPKVYENHPNDSRITGPLDVAPTVVSRFGTGGGNVPLVNNEAITFQPGNLRREAGADPSFTTTTTTLKASAGDQTPHVATPMAVRRLTPVECERLQGFPDNWSRISWKGKPETECPDGPRYKACGNSMAVPVMRWIGERIAAVDATLSPNA